MNQQDYTNGRYNKIPDEVRDRLVEMVIVHGFTIKESSRLLHLKYSTGKTIFKVYNKEHRTAKLKTRCRHPEGKIAGRESRKIRGEVPSFLQRFKLDDRDILCGTRITERRLRSTPDKTLASNHRPTWCQ